MQNFLKRLRKEKGITLKELAKRAGFAPSTINNFENGRAGASQEFLQKMAETLEVDESEILPRKTDVRESHPAYGSMSGEAALLQQLLADMPLDQLLERLNQVLFDDSLDAKSRLQGAMALMPSVLKRTEELEREKKKQ